MQFAKLEVDEEIEVDASSDAVWTVLKDPRVVVQCVAGARVLDVHDDGSIAGALAIKLGPTLVEFIGDVTIEFDDAAKQGNLVGSGAAKNGKANAQATATFLVSDTDDPARSRLKIDVELGVTGGLSAFVRTGGVHLARRMLADFAMELGSVATDGALVTATEPPIRSNGIPPTTSTRTAAAGTVPKPLKAGTLVWFVIIDWFKALPASLRRRVRTMRGSSDTSTGLDPT